MGGFFCLKKGTIMRKIESEIYDDIWYRPNQRKKERHVPSIRSGVQMAGSFRADAAPDAPTPIPFSAVVHIIDYAERVTGGQLPTITGDRQVEGIIAKAIVYAQQYPAEMAARKELMDRQNAEVASQRPDKNNTFHTIGINGTVDHSPNGQVTESHANGVSDRTEIKFPVLEPALV